MDDELDSMKEPSEWRVYSVSELTRSIKKLLEESFPPIWVEGEVSNFHKHASGHLYFTLKDSDTQIACVMWRGRNQNLVFQPQDGMKLQVLGSITVYERQGKYQLDVLRLRPAGIGELQLAFEVLKKRLAEEGLFDSEHKKALPPFPRVIGVVTSPTGAAVRDIVSVIQRRFPAAEIVLSPVHVQGENAAGEIAGAIAEFNEYGKVDVLIVGRGGGSMEDLWAFNEENVARAVYASRIPVVSAVGHEIDFTITDFVADLRMPTPSAAAERIVPDSQDLIRFLGQKKEGIQRTMENRIRGYRDRLEPLVRSYAFRWTTDRIQEYRQRTDDLQRSAERAVSFQVSRCRELLGNLQSRLSTVHPESVLRRGYSITRRLPDQSVVTRASQLSPQQDVEIRFFQGKAVGRINQVLEE
jgi:exodeoxyribonuclease VII large subunit